MEQAWLFSRGNLQRFYHPMRNIQWLCLSPLEDSYLKGGQSQQGSLTLNYKQCDGNHGLLVEIKVLSRQCLDSSTVVIAAALFGMECQWYVTMA